MGVILNKFQNLLASFRLFSSQTEIGLPSSTAQALSCGCSSDRLCLVEVCDTCRSQEHSQQATACHHAAQQMLRSRPGGCCTPLPFQTALLFAEDQVYVNLAEHVSSPSMSIYKNVHFSKKCRSKDHIGKHSPH